MATSDDVRVGLVGYGWVGRFYHAPLINSTEGMTLAGISSSDRAKVQADWPAVRVYPNPLDLIRSGNVDLVVIASPNLTHVPLATVAIEAGVHVVVEKPFTPTTGEARYLIDLAERHTVMLSVFHNRRWDSDYLSLRDAIESGRLGRIVHFESKIERFRPLTPDKWRELPLPASGLWFDVGPHLVDQALQLFDIPDAVVASLARQRDGAVNDDWASVTLEYGGTRAILQCSMTAARQTFRFLVHGTEGSALKRKPDPQSAQLQAGMKPGSIGWGVDSDPLVLINGLGEEAEQVALGDHRRYYMAVVDHLRGQGLNPVPGIQALVVTAVLEAAVASARASGRVGLDLSDAERDAWQASTTFRLT